MLYMVASESSRAEAVTETLWQVGWSLPHMHQQVHEPYIQWTVQVPWSVSDRWNGPPQAAAWYRILPATGKVSDRKAVGVSDCIWKENYVPLQDVNVALHIQGFCQAGCCGASTHTHRTCRTWLTYTLWYYLFSTDEGPSFQSVLSVQVTLKIMLQVAHDGFRNIPITVKILAEVVCSCWRMVFWRQQLHLRAS